MQRQERATALESTLRAQGRTLVAWHGRHLLRFSTGSHTHLALVYHTRLERLYLAKAILMGNPDLVNQSWLNSHTAKFDQGEGENGDLTIKPEFRNFPFMGIGPISLAQKLIPDALFFSSGPFSLIQFPRETELEHPIFSLLKDPVSP